MKRHHKIAIVGAGGIGRAVALILAELSEVAPDVYLGDIYVETAEEAAEWALDGVTKPCAIHAFTMVKEGINDDMRRVFDECEILLDCLPGSQAPRMAAFAKEYGMHYANLTEYVNETNQVIDIATGASTGFVLQTGLAPGFVNIVANALYMEFSETYEVKNVEYIGMKVGALTQNASAPHFYGFTWSPIGVATEYVKDAIAIRDFKKTTVPALSAQERIIIDGATFEVDLTSGGAADLPDAFAGVAKNLDYKTIRYPGHYDWVKGILAANADKNTEDQINILQEEMMNNIPHLEDDLVVIHVNVIGKDSKGTLRAIEKTYFIGNQEIGNQTLRAIQTTTAAPLCECARMLLEGGYSGPVFQSQLDPFAFMEGVYVKEVYGEY
jgi:saccharopine dehydrogenase-like NADP-dependent oxidoreductase